MLASFFDLLHQVPLTDYELLVFVELSVISLLLVVALLKLLHFNLLRKAKIDGCFPFCGFIF